MKIVIEAVTYTPDQEPVHIHYRGHRIYVGPFAKTTICHTTQTDLRARSTDAAYWSDIEIKAELVAHLASLGIEAEIITHPGPNPAKT